MKYSLLFAIIIFCSCANALKKNEPIVQTFTDTVVADIDSLEKYSYFIYGIRKNSILKGTFFLIRDNDKTYFITAAHVITGWNSVRNIQEEDYPNAMRLRFYLKNDAKKTFLINTAKFKSESNHLLYYEEADLFVSEIQSARGLAPQGLQNIFMMRADPGIR